MLGSVYCNGGKTAALNSQCPAPGDLQEPEREEDDCFPLSARGDNAQQAVADSCGSITCPEANKDKVQRKTAGGKSRSSHVTQEENNCSRDISRP